jgi:hypothetical protein
MRERVEELGREAEVLGTSGCARVTSWAALEVDRIFFKATL